jgi:hypothetical protein
VITMGNKRRHGQENSAVKTPGTPGVRGLSDRPPLACGPALRGPGRCVVRTMRLLRQRRIHFPAEQVGKRLRFADEISGRADRDTVVDRGATQDPCVLVPKFRQRAVRGRRHAVSRWESLLNAPQFAGLPGLVAKLRLTDDEHGRYRGLYEWDGPQLAEKYAPALWRVLALVSVRGPIHYMVLPRLGRDELLSRPQVLADAAAWWRLASVS